MKHEDVRPGDWVYRLVWVGGEENAFQELEVLKVHPKTLDVRTKYGDECRVRLDDVVGFVDWEM